MEVHSYPKFRSYFKQPYTNSKHFIIFINWWIRTARFASQWYSFSYFLLGSRELIRFDGKYFAGAVQGCCWRILRVFDVGNSATVTDDVSFSSKLQFTVTSRGKIRKPKIEATKSERRNIWTAYILWFFFGIFGVHHFYLRRDRQAFVWWCTLGGYLGCGWLRDIFYIPRYVEEANNDEEYVKKFTYLMNSHTTPPFSVSRFAGMLIVGYLFGSVLGFAIPEERTLGINWNFLHYLAPLACAIGVWLVGNIGREQGKIWWCLAAAYAAYPFSMYIEDDTTWFTLMVLSSTLAFDNMSKEWRRKPREKKTTCQRLSRLGVGALIYLALWGCSFYFNGEITDSEGESIPIRDAMRHFFTSPWWLDVHQSLMDVWNFARHRGLYEAWKQIIDLSDPHGEINAYKVLEIDSSATQSEITSKWRILSKEYHPDKVKDPDKKQEAQNKFMEIQQAYEILSSIKVRRKNKNRRSARY